MHCVRTLKYLTIYVKHSREGFGKVSMEWGYGEKEEIL